MQSTESYLVKQQDNQLFRQVRLLTHDNSDFNKYFLFVDCSSHRKKKDELSTIIKSGVTIDNRHFVLSERSASMCRNAELGFIDEKISKQLDEIIGLGLQFDKVSISKHVAYRGLMLSSCFCLENWIPKIIVVDDFQVTIPNQHIRFLEDEKKEYIDKTTGKKKIWNGKHVTDGYKDIDILPWDGLGLIHPDLSREIKSLIGIINESPTSWMIRGPFIKGVVHSIPYDKFWVENGITEIEDVYGQKWDSQGKYIILTKSQFKGFKFFKTFDDYLSAFRKYNHCFGIAKWNYPVEKEPRFTRTSYQTLQTLDLPYEEFKHLADYSKDLIEKIISGDKVYTNTFLGLFADNVNPQNDYMKAILKNPEMLKDPHLHKYYQGMLRKYITEMKCGKLWVKGSFKILASDLVMLMQKIAGIEANGVLTEDEFWAKSYEGVCRGQYSINRNPHIAASEALILDGKGYDRWHNHLDNVIVLNAKSIVLPRLSGADSDGDLALVSNDGYLVSGAKYHLPVLDVEDKASAKEKELTLDNIVESVLFSFSNMIGEYSNMATSYLNRTPRTEEQIQRYLDNVDYISVLNGKEIDRAKTGLSYHCPKYISKFSKPLPYFMRYASSYYARLKKFSRAQSNLNRLCFELEKWEQKLKRKKEHFKWSILLDTIIPKNDEIFEKIYDLYLEFKENQEVLRKYQYFLIHKKKFDSKSTILTQQEINDRQINWEYRYDIFRKRAASICPNKKELANYAVEICYKIFSKNVKTFAWVVAKTGMIDNIKPVDNELPIETIDGEFEYLGHNYDLVKITPTK